MTRYASRYEKIARRLSMLQLMRSSTDEETNSEADLLSEPPPRFLDFYGDQGLLDALEEYGFLDQLRQRGFDNFNLDIRHDDDRHTVLIEAEPMVTADPARIIEVAAHRAYLIPDHDLVPPLGDQYRVLNVDWTLMQNPFVPFTQERLRLPGQDAPGLGVGESFVELIVRIVARLELDAWVTVPAYFHNAALYARELFYFDPCCQGEFEAICRCLLEENELSLAQATWAIDWGHLLKNGQPWSWQGEAQVYPACDDLTEWVQSNQYKDAVSESCKEQRFTLDRDGFDKQWEDDAGLLVGSVSPLLA